MPFIRDRSITNPPSQTQVPGKLWAPPRTDTSRVWSRAKVTALRTSATPTGRQIRPGRRSILAFQTWRASA